MKPSLSAIEPPEPCKFPESRAPQAFSVEKCSPDWRKNLGSGEHGFQTPTAPADDSKPGVNKL
jgi:hypothetical protein